SLSVPVAATPLLLPCTTVKKMLSPCLTGVQVLHRRGSVGYTTVCERDQPLGYPILPSKVCVDYIYTQRTQEGANVQTFFGGCLLRRQRDLHLLLVRVISYRSLNALLSRGVGLVSRKKNQNF
ncbi:unnamed protein product, partial [Ectocarpus sp. 12 AP-2014]